MRRQRILAGPDAVKLWVVMDEAALLRPVGGPATMRAQIEHLLKIGERRHAVGVMPLSFGGHSAGGGPITILRLPAGACRTWSISSSSVGPLSGQARWLALLGSSPTA